MLEQVARNEQEEDSGVLHDHIQDLMRNRSVFPVQQYMSAYHVNNGHPTEVVDVADEFLLGWSSIDKRCWHGLRRGRFSCYGQLFLHFLQFGCWHLELC